LLKLELTTQHSGKMQGMQSISTSCKTNPTCAKNSKIDGSICQKCYAQQFLSLRPALNLKCLRNTALLTEKELKNEDVPFINAQFFRLEAFGELYNETHLKNYLMLVRKNPHVLFALWSKNYDLIYDYFSKNQMPDNLNVLLSSIMINKPISINRFIEAGVDVKTFTVYSKEFVAENSIKINCGSTKCSECLLCYKKDMEKEICELLKSDQKRVKGGGNVV
jgi:hypothetical protein